MLSRPLILTIFIAISGLISSTAWAISTDDVDNLVAQYGKPALIDLILDARAGIVTLALPQGNIERYGRPSPEFVNSTTLGLDLEQAGLDSATATAKLKAMQEKEQRFSKRMTPTQPSVLPLVGYLPTMRIRGHRRTWTVEQLIKDAYKTKPSWPDWLNKIRMREANQRNQAVANVLRDMETRYGNPDIDKVARAIDRQHRQEVRACRAIRHRKRNPEYALRGCPEIVANRQPSKFLRQRLREPFKVFAAKMKPHIKRFLDERKLKSIY
jgi:hypothetical protein